MVNKNVVCLFLLVFIASVSGCVSEPASSDGNIDNNVNIEEIEGLWLGSLKVQGGMEMRLLFNISTDPDGSVNATMDSLDQGTKGIPVDVVSHIKTAICTWE